MAAMKKLDGDSVPISEFFQELRDGDRTRSARREARIKDRIEALIALPPGTIAEAERRLSEIEDLRQLLGEWARFRNGGRPKGDAAEHIRRLVAEHPTLAHKPGALYRLRDKSIVRSMKPGTWRNKVAKAVPRQK